MRMSLLVLALAAGTFLAAPAFAGSAASSSSEAIVSGGSVGSSSVTVTASDKGSAEAGEIFGTSEATSSNVATGSDTTKGFAVANFESGGESEAEEIATHF